MRFFAFAFAALLLAACAPNPQGLTERCDGYAPFSGDIAGAVRVAYRRASGRDLDMYVFRPAEANGAAVLLFFGGGWRLGDVTALEGQARALAAQGYTVFLADYRVKCRDNTSPVDATADARAAYAWLRQHAREWEIDVNRIVLGGGSAGGQLALVAAMRAEAQPAAIVLFNPAVDLVTPAPWYLRTMARGISPAHLPIERLAPVIIFHGVADERVPIASVRAFCARLNAAGRACTLVEYEGAQHGFYHQREGEDGQPAPFDDTIARAIAFLAETGVNASP